MYHVFHVVGVEVGSKDGGLHMVNPTPNAQAQRQDFLAAGLQVQPWCHGLSREVISGKLLKSLTPVTIGISLVVS